MVTASRGKRTRAEPVALMYEPGDNPAGSEVRHGDHFPELVDQMVTWIPGKGASPDRVDALVWAVTWLIDASDDNSIGFVFA